MKAIAPDAGQIEKLPKWAQKYISDLCWERDKAVEKFQAREDTQSPSPFYIEDWDVLPTKRLYVQSPNRRITAVHAGVRLSVFLPHKEDGQREFGIELCYEPELGRLGINPIAILPRGINTIQLVHRDNMR